METCWDNESCDEDAPDEGLEEAGEECWGDNTLPGDCCLVGRVIVAVLTRGRARPRPRAGADNVGFLRLKLSI